MKNVLKMSWILMLALLLAGNSWAASKTEIDINVQSALKRFQKEVNGGKAFLDKAAGVLVLPEVLKAGFGIGGEYGEGALMVNHKTVEYYSTASASIGFQIGAQSKSIVLVFMNEKSLSQFRRNDGWEAGVDGSVAVAEWGAGKDINSVNIEDPIVGFVFSNKGLMYNLTIEGSKFTKIVR